jgi:hypothetical protein
MKEMAQFFLHLKAGTCDRHLIIWYRQQNGQKKKKKRKDRQYFEEKNTSVIPSNGFVRLVMGWFPTSAWRAMIGRRNWSRPMNL